MKLGDPLSNVTALAKMEGVRPQSMGATVAGLEALGLVKGGTYRRDGTCLFYYYMSTDYLPQGWTLLHQ